MTNDKKIIIVEDDEDINNLLAYNLGKEGFTVEQVFDGVSAIQRIKEDVFNLIILDIMLPGINGFDICRQIKDDPRYYRSFIVVISAKCREQDKLYAHLLGADCYLTKPFNLANLLSAVKEICASLDKEYVVENG
ncbi:MAG: response regulator [Candidatus Omnitrophica bacterium]|jgi:DNA-binding response OmpR family regulator|nr:response regulator [Candidatus Omnitrophota bacterium]MDD5690385.1 response regulator [Candidatus Omnitrophota bacterium]